MMFRKQWAAALTFIGVVVLTGCGGQAAPTVQPQETAAATVAPATAAVSPLPTPAVAESPLASPQTEVTDVAGLIAALQAAGATVETGNKIEQPFFEVQGTEVKINGQTAQVFEWADEASRAAVSQTITPQGQFGTTMIEWTGAPHFWAAGKIIALYVGDDAQVIEALTRALGAPITQN